MVDGPTPKLTLIISDGLLPSLAPVPPSAHRLAARIVDAARAWSSLASLLSDVIADTEEGALRLALLDAVHDLEHAETNMAASPHGMRPLFGDGSG